MININLKIGEQCQLSNGVIIRILKPRIPSRREISIGISAPRHISIYRSEVYDRLKQSKII